MNLLPCPRQCQLTGGYYALLSGNAAYFEPSFPWDVALPIARRLLEAAKSAGAQLELITGFEKHPHLAFKAKRSRSAPGRPEAYVLEITRSGISLLYREIGGLRMGIATLRQLLREYRCRLPCLRMVDYPEFPRRGVMLDVSRGRVPNLDTLRELAGQLADLKLNELQLYTEHTFAYRNYEDIWKDWGALTAGEILELDEYCRQLGIDLVPNQNSFGHLRYWLEHPLLRRLAEVKEPYEGAGGTFLRYPTTLAPTNPGTVRFLGELYDELLPCFTSSHFNVGCDETWDLGRGQSARLCERKGKGRVYLDFLLRIHEEVASRRRRMQFWGDIILHHPELINKLPTDAIALNWGYEKDHPFEKETALFAKSGIPFYVCPGTSTWMTLIGRNDNSFANLRAAAEAGSRHQAAGYLITDWGDGGHPQPLPISYAAYLTGAALAWSPSSFRPDLVLPVLSRDFMEEPTGKAAEALLRLGVAHTRFEYFAPNITPFGTVIAAPKPETRELACRDGLKYYARIPRENILAAQDEVLLCLDLLRQAKPASAAAQTRLDEVRIAAEMAGESCRIMLWQQAAAGDRKVEARTLAKAGIPTLKRIRDEFNAYWPSRNKGTTAKCAPFLDWRIDDYRRQVLHFPPAAAK